jgi:hypothetical protein
MKLAELIALLETTKKRSQEFDALIGAAIVDVSEARVPEPIARNGRPMDIDSASVAQRYTGSIDAAVTLVPAGWSWDVRAYYSHLPAPIVRAAVFNDRTGMVLSGEYCEAEADTAPVALCIAALRARAVLRWPPLKQT